MHTENDVKVDVSVVHHSLKITTLEYEDRNRE